MPTVQAKGKKRKTKPYAIIIPPVAVPPREQRFSCGCVWNSEGWKIMCKTCKKNRPKPPVITISLREGVRRALKRKDPVILRWAAQGETKLAVEAQAMAKKLGVKLPAKKVRKKVAK